MFFCDDFQALAVTDVSDIGGVTFLMDCSLIDLNKEMHSGEVLLCGSWELFSKRLYISDFLVNYKVFI